MFLMMSALRAYFAMIKIHTNDIRIGMYVSGLDRDWVGTPFSLQGFRIENEQQIQKLRELCDYVEIDEHRSTEASMSHHVAVNRWKNKGITSLKKEASGDQSPVLESVPLPSHTEMIDYSPDIALEFFKTFGAAETIEQNVALVSEGQKPNRLFWQHNKMYFLVQGEVSILVGGKNVGAIKVGEIFGELTPLILAKRSATVVTNSRCELISLDEKQFVAGLEKQPEFALMLMGVLIERLRQTMDEVKTIERGAEIKIGNSMRIFTSKMMRDLEQKLDDSTVTRISAQQTIFRKGGIGMLMYVILEGYVIAILDDKVVERSGPGCVIGEIALVDQKRRLARVVAETDCCLLAINRQAFFELVKTQPAFSLSLLQALASRLRFWRTGEMLDGEL